MSKTYKKIIALTAITSLLLACGGNDQKKVTETMEQIQAKQGKPAVIITPKESSVKDIREFSGSIEGSRQTNALAKMSDPISKINVQVGSYVKKDQVLAEFTYTGDNTQYQQAAEQVKLLEASAKRIHEVFEQGGISQQDVDEIDTKLNIAKMNLKTAQRATQVLAPAGGVVTDVRFKVGEVPANKSIMFTVANLNTVILKLNITTKNIGLFKRHAKAYIVQDGDTLIGKVSMIPLAANSVTHFFPVEITFYNKGKKLLPGMFVTAKVDVDTHTGITVPNESIVYNNGINYLWLVDEKGKAMRKIISIIVADTHNSVVSGISLSDKVMLNGMTKMSEGDKVLIVKQ